MNKTLTAVALSVLFGLTACQEESVKQSTVETIKLDTEDNKNSYALGVSVGGFLKKQLDSHNEVGVPLIQDLVVKGIMDGLGDAPELSEQETQEQINKLQTAYRTKTAAIQAAKSEQNKTASATYLQENKAREGVVVTASGLQYEVLTMGDGSKPSATDTVKVHYHGTLISGEVFDSSVDRGEPAVFPLNRVISGWTEGLQLMPVGSKFRFHIPSELAYGERSTGKITPNSTLIFDVELLGIEGEAK